MVQEKEDRIPHPEIWYFIFNFLNKLFLLQWSMLCKIHKIKVYRWQIVSKRNISTWLPTGSRHKTPSASQKRLPAPPPLPLYSFCPQAATLLLLTPRIILASFWTWYKRNYTVCLLGGKAFHSGFWLGDSSLLLLVACLFISVLIVSVVLLCHNSVMNYFLLLRSV